jgi:hypothetical protein
MLAAYMTSGGLKLDKMPHQVIIQCGLGRLLILAQVVIPGVVKNVTDGIIKV